MSRDPARRIADVNILVHEYFGVDVDIVRDVVETHLPPLAEALRGHLAAD